MSRVRSQIISFLHFGSLSPLIILLSILDIIFCFCSAYDYWDVFWFPTTANFTILSLAVEQAKEWGGQLGVVKVQSKSQAFFLGVWGLGPQPDFRSFENWDLILGYFTVILQIKPSLLCSKIFLLCFLEFLFYYSQNYSYSHAAPIILQIMWHIIIL